jgi:glycerophosphoryl diester phosphodiesterase
MHFRGTFGLLLLPLSCASAAEVPVLRSSVLADAAAPDAALIAPDAAPMLDAGAAAAADAEAAVRAVVDAGTAADAGAPDATFADAAPRAGDFRSSLAACWTDPACRRAGAIDHGGEWSATGAPYDSNAAITAAYEGGADGVKVDVRVTRDDVPVIAHSSPIQLYESIDCYNKRIEEMTADEVTACHRFPSTTETFQRLDEVLDFVRGKMLVQLTVKLSSDYARTIAELIATNAEDFAFMEISGGELQNLIPTLPGSERIYYLVDVGSTYSEIDTIIDVVRNPKAFMIEMDASSQVSALVTSRIHPAGLRAFTYDSSPIAGVSELVGLFEQGFDVVSSQAGGNGVQARQQVNQTRGISPP